MRSMSEHPLVSIIIPHQAGTEVLLRCLDSLVGDDTHPPYEILLVDNGSSDGSVQVARERHPQLRVLRFEENQGYAGGCNRGIEVSSGKYVLLLNDDTELEPGWLAELVRAAEEDASVGACQPKIRSLREPDLFEYSGAAGGLMDIYAYPFSRGRLMDHVEEDHGQYDDPIEIFWASGVAMLVRRSALDAAGLFDEVFFAYMEEIDLCWRIQLQGYRIRYVPSAVVRHIGGFSLDKRVLKRMYLNHRNSMITLVKNYSAPSLLRVLPVKLFLEAFIMGGALLRNPKRSRAVVMAFAWLLTHLPTVLRLRAEVQGARRVPDSEIFPRLYLGMAPLWYFVFGIRQVTDLPDIDRVLHRPCAADRPPQGAVVRPEQRDFLYAYLDQAPTGLAIQRALECELFATRSFARPILDAGCGDGVFSRMLFNGVILDCGADADPEEVERARRTRCYAEVKTAQLEALPWEAESMATVLVNGVNSRVRDTEGALREIHRVLRPGGSLYLSVPTGDWVHFQIWSRGLRRLGLARAAEAYERLKLRQLGAKGIEEPDVWAGKLRAAGFELESREFYLSRRAARLQDLFMPAALISSLSKQLLGRALALPRIHRLLVRAYRGGLRGALSAPVERGAGVFLVARRP